MLRVPIDNPSDVHFNLNSISRAFVDWSEGEKDGFPGNIGTVIRDDDEGYVKCIFDGQSREVPSLRMGVRTRLFCLRLLLLVLIDLSKRSDSVSYVYILFFPFLSSVFLQVRDLYEVQLAFGSNAWLSDHSGAFLLLHLHTYPVFLFRFTHFLVSLSHFGFG